MESPRTIGHIVSVQGFRVKVELLPETKSALRATLDGVQIAVAINAYLTFSIGAGQIVIGIITDLESRESYDLTSGDDLTLELMKSRRTASVQLLGTIDVIDKKPVFNPGITILPTLDTPAEIGAPDTLNAIFEIPPKRNRPEGYKGDDFDCDLLIGCPTGQPANAVRASYNDLFSRPLAIVGNTGSGKSFSVSSLVQRAMNALGDKGNEPHVFILDINGEYSRAFPSGKSEPERRPDRIYLNDVEFSVPIWMLNAEEVCAWLSASEQTQEPVLKDWWALAKAQGRTLVSTHDANSLRHAMAKAKEIIDALDAKQRPKKKPALISCKLMAQYLNKRKIDGLQDLYSELEVHKDVLKDDARVDFDSPLNEPQIRAATERVIEGIKAQLTGEFTLAKLSATTADSPLYIAKERLVDPTLLDSATPPEDASRIEAHLTTLKLRLSTRVDDPRWHCFLNYSDGTINIASVQEWLAKFGLGARSGPRVNVIDLSMLSYEVLPYACSVVGRILLEARENLAAADRYKHPWVLVLEEAHNYARPRRADEERGQNLSRRAFERIAKEGRKFGLSLVVASQRPSEISETIISQCANFISHRLQNPDDIDHCKHPAKAREFRFAREDDELM